MLNSLFQSWKRNSNRKMDHWLPFHLLSLFGRTLCFIKPAQLWKCAVVMQNHRNEKCSSALDLFNSLSILVLGKSSPSVLFRWMSGMLPWSVLQALQQTWALSCLYREHWRFQGIYLFLLVASELRSFLLHSMNRCFQIYGSQRITERTVSESHICPR